MNPVETWIFLLGRFLAQLRGETVPPAPADTTGPTVTLTLSDTVFNTAGPLVMTAEASDPSGIARVEFWRGSTKLGQKTSAPYTLTVDVQGAAQAGEYRAVAYDVPGNQKATPGQTVTVDMSPLIPDTTPPVPVLWASASSFLLDGVLTLNASGADAGGGPVTLTLTRDGTPITIPENGVVTETITRASNGEHTYVLVATDAAGNQASTFRKITVDIPTPDTTPPVISGVTMPGLSGTTITASGPQLFVCAVTDDRGVQRVEFSRPGEPTQTALGIPFQAYLPFSAADNGTLTVTVRAYDAAGNSDEFTVSLTVNIANTQPVTYEPIPSYSLASGDVTFTGRYFRRTDPGTAFSLSSGYGKLSKLTLIDCIIRANGSAFAGFRARLKLINCILIIDPPTEYGKSAPRAISMQEFADWQMENVTVIGGAGFVGTGLNNAFYGNPANGDGVRWTGIKYHNIDGRRSDGAGGYIKSNWANGHANNADRIANNGEIGWDIANFLQANSCPGTPISIKWVEVLCGLGQGRTEDTVSLYGGSGGSAAYPGVFEDCLFDTSGGWDWNYVKGSSTSYDASNQVTAGATSYQKVSDTRSSGTAIIIGDAARSEYDKNSSYLTLRRVIGIGARSLIGNDYAHHIRYEACESYLMAKHWSGVDYVNYHDGFFQIRPKTATATYQGGTRQIFGAIEFFNNVWGTPGTPGPFELSAAQMVNGGSQGGNMKVLPPADGGRQIIRDFRARAAAAGVALGSTLPIPDSLPAGLVADAFAEYV